MANYSKLVVAVSSGAILNLKHAQKIFDEQGGEAYRRYQEKNKHRVLGKGAAFPFIRQLLAFNTIFEEEQPVDVVILSKNSFETCERVDNSLEHYGLNIKRGAFVSGASPYRYMKAFNASLFLSTNENDVRQAIKLGYGAGLVLTKKVDDKEMGPELRIAFDFDGVLADDESERVFKTTKSIEAFRDHEISKNLIAHKPGPLQPFIKQLMALRDLDIRRSELDLAYERLVRVALVTARSKPAHRRVINTLKTWNVSIDETFYMAGLPKKPILEVFDPHLFFDDQLSHLEGLENIPAVHIPFGIANL